MTYSEIMAIARETGLPFAYDHFAEGEVLKPPFLVFLFPDSNNFSADGKVYQKVEEVRFELYTAKKQPNIESQVEAIFDAHELFYEKSEVWVESIKLYEISYTMEVLMNG